MKENKEIHENPVRSGNHKTVNETAAAPAPGWRKLFTRKWMFPAAYIAAAAIILTLMWVYQDSASKAPPAAGEETTVSEDSGATVEPDGVQPEGALPVNAAAEEMKWPVANRNDLDVVMKFYDNEASSEERQAAMIKHDNTFIPSTGISFSRPDNQPFDVLAAMSGKVTQVANVPLIGHKVEITHDNGLKTEYLSLAEIVVKEGDTVKQGQVIAKAGRNELEQDQGVHLHFEILQDGTPVNPETFIAEN
ncbi:MAG TPA: M23 family metallopeptidase [Bacilli bacterium]